MKVLILAGMALVCYLPGCINGAIVASRLFFHDDVRKHGSGNAGLTNFYRTYGAKNVVLVILIDMLKTVLSVYLGSWVFSRLFGPEGALLGKYFGAFFCIVGHMFPFLYHFKGGKGILSGGMTLFLLDWRIALVGWGGFLLLTALTRYVSLGSLFAAASLTATTAVVFRGERYYPQILLLAAMISALVIWAHRENIKRLLSGSESKFSLHRKKE